MFFTALSCAEVKKYACSPVPSLNKKCTARAVEKKKVPSLPVVEEIIYRPVPSSKKIHTVPSRRDIFHLPSRRVVTIFTYRPVPS